LLFSDNSAEACQLTPGKFLFQPAASLQSFGRLSPRFVAVTDLLHKWRQPEHDDFRPRNAWSLFNACTEVFKRIKPHTVVNRSQALHGQFDGLIGLS